MQITVAVSEHEFTEMDTSPEMLKESIRNALMRGIEDECPDGQVKFPHPWPPQIPPGRTAGL